MSEPLPGLAAELQVLSTRMLTLEGNVRALEGGAEKTREIAREALAEVRKPFEFKPETPPTFTTPPPPSSLKSSKSK